MLPLIDFSDPADKRMPPDLQIVAGLAVTAVFFRAKLLRIGWAAGMRHLENRVVPAGLLLGDQSEAADQHHWGGDHIGFDIGSDNKAIVVGA